MQYICMAGRTIWRKQVDLGNQNRELIVQINGDSQIIRVLELLEDPGSRNVYNTYIRMKYLATKLN